MGMNPVMRADATPVMEQQFFNISGPQQLVFQPPGEKIFYRHLNGSIFLHAPEAITHLSHIDSNKIAKAAIARKYIRDILGKERRAGAVQLDTLRVSHKSTCQTCRAFTESLHIQIIKSCFLNRRSPIDEWKRIFHNASEIKAWLNSMQVRHYHIESQHMDLEITPGESRKWIGISGHNIPSFELFLSPDWRGTRGVYHADQPSFRSGNLVKGHYDHV